MAKMVVGMAGKEETDALMLPCGGTGRVAPPCP